MPKVIAYARVSTDKQDAENQEYELRRYMERNGIVCDEVITEVVSGTVKVKDRKVGTLIDDLRDGDTLIVSEISRLSRDMLTIANIIQQCLSMGVKIIAVKEGWTLGADPGSKFTAVAFGMAAEIERNFISQRTKEALARKKSEGVVLGRPVGSFQHKHYKLHGRDEEIMALMEKRISIAALARIFNVNRKTMQTYIEDNDLRRKVFNKTPVSNIWTK